MKVKCMESVDKKRPPEKGGKPGAQRSFKKLFILSLYIDNYSAISDIFK
jgi:hypothetical protein